jgi:tetratricopeptide (TPR) repeat protein
MHAAMLAEALYEQGRDSEAERYLAISKEIAAAADYTSQAAWRSVKGRVLARRGELDEAEDIARQAVGFTFDRAESIVTPSAWSGLGETLALAGKHEEAEQAFARAIRLHEQKENTAGAARIRDLAARSGLQIQ